MQVSFLTSIVCSDISHSYVSYVTCIINQNLHIQWHIHIYMGRCFSQMKGFSLNQRFWLYILYVSRRRMRYCIHEHMNTTTKWCFFSCLRNIKNFNLKDSFSLFGLIRSVWRALSSKLRGPGFKSWPSTMGHYNNVGCSASQVENFLYRG